MSGIIGYIGNKRVVPVLLEGLQRLQYRGYDSAGLAVIRDGALDVRRATGKLRNLEEAIRQNPLDGAYGIGHTRWATHGAPTEENAHPHRDCHGTVVVVHNGIIENYVALKQGLVAVRQGPPAVIGLGKDEYFVASDVPAILYHTHDLLFLADGDLAVLTPDGVKLTDFDGNPVSRRVEHVTWDPILAEKGGFKHFMMKEIYEQPRAVRDTMLGRFSPQTGHVFLDEMEITEEDFRSFRDIKIVAAGTSHHAGLAGKIMIERLARVPVEVDYASKI